MRGHPTPTYDLAELQAKVTHGHVQVTVRALRDAGAMGFDQIDIFECVCSLTYTNFYKTMPSETVNGVFQDVYKTRWCGVPIYTKLTYGDARKTVVISFHNDKSANPGGGKS